LRFPNGFLKFGMQTDMPKRKPESREAFPLTIVKDGVLVTIYRHSHQKKNTAGEPVEYLEFKVAWKEGPRRKLQSFCDLAEAKAHADRVGKRISNGDAASLELKADDRIIYRRALHFLKGTGTPLDVACERYALAVASLGNVPLQEAIEDYRRRHPAAMPRKTVADAVADCLAAKQADGVSDLYHRTLKLRLERLADSFVQTRLASLTAPLLNEWLRGLGCKSPRTRNNYRTDVVSFLHYCEAAGFLPKDHIDEKQVVVVRDEAGKIEIFTPEEMAKLIAATADNRDLRVHILLGAFAGLRSAEIERQQWRDVNLERGFLRVSGAKLGTAANRLVYFPDNLKAWLAPLVRRTGPVSCLVRPDGTLRRLGARAGVRWKRNALRHSFISYRVALSGDVAKTAVECGNSPRVIFAHYRELVSEGEAQAWFGIAPARPANVIPAPQAAAVA
jgi:integrase